jgi:hypothetical protein
MGNLNPKIHMQMNEGQRGVNVMELKAAAIFGREYTM